MLENLFTNSNTLLPLLLIVSGGVAAVIIGSISLRLNKKLHYELTRRIETETALRIKTDELEAAAQRTDDDRKRLGTILSSMGEGVIVFDQSSTITLMNQAAAILLRIAPAAAEGKPLWDLFPFYKGDGDTASAQKLVERVLTNADMITIRLSHDFYFKREDGKEYPLTMVLSSVLTKNGIEGGIIAFRDATEEKIVDRAKGEFVSLASHQLHTPLTTSSLYLELLLSEGSGNLTEEQRIHLNEVVLATRRMTELVKALLDVSKIELGTFASEPELIDLVEVTESAIDELMPHFKQKMIAIKRGYPENLQKIMADPKHVRMVLQNLLSNAIKYTHQEGVVGIDIEDKGSEILLGVHDNGLGIPPSQQDKIFTKLFRADNAKALVPDGTGLGLYIVKAVVEEFGGQIWFDSKEGIGTTFSVTIPTAPHEVKDAIDLDQL